MTYMNQSSIRSKQNQTNKRLHNIWVHLDDVLNKAKVQWQRLVVSRSWEGKGLTAMWHEENLGYDRNVLYFYCASGYTIL